MTQHVFFFFFKQKTAYEIRPCDWSSDVCSSDLILRREEQQAAEDLLHRRSIRCSAAASPRSGASHHEIVPLLRHFLGRRARRAPPREARSTGRRYLCGTAGPRSPAARTSRLARAPPGAGAAASPRIRRTGESAVLGAPAGARRFLAASSGRRLAGR